MKSDYIIKYIVENTNLVDDEHCERVRYIDKLNCTSEELCEYLKIILNKYIVNEINIEKS